jgi:glycosyltransferase involved in cell wall biosynthesis
MHNTKKICIVGPSKRFLSGISYYTICLANALEKECNVSVIYFRNLLPRFLFPGRAHVDKNISSLNLTQNIHVFDGMDYNNPITWLYAYKFLKKERPEIIILQWWTSSVAHMHLVLKLLARVIDSKMIIEFHEVVDPLEDSFLPIRLYSSIMGKILRRNAVAYIAHSESDRQMIAQRYDIDVQKIHIIPFGLFDHHGEPIDYHLAKKSLEINEEFVILSFGLIRKYKGIPFLIEAFEQLPDEIILNSRLLIVGEIWENRKELINKISSSKQKEKITLIDKYVPDDMISLYFSAADIVVLPYLRASQSGIAHIAMTFGKPIVVSEVGGLKESMAEYKGTFFVKPGNVIEIKNAMIKSHNLQSHFSVPERGWDITVKKYLDLIESI